MGWRYDEFVSKEWPCTCARRRDRTHNGHCNYLVETEGCKSNARRVVQCMLNQAMTRLTIVMRHHSRTTRPVALNGSADMHTRINASKQPQHANVKPHRSSAPATYDMVATLPYSSTHMLLHILMSQHAARRAPNRAKEPLVHVDYSTHRERVFLSVARSICSCGWNGRRHGGQ